MKNSAGRGATADLSNEEVAEQGERITRKNVPDQSHAKNYRRKLGIALKCAVQDEAILRQGVYRRLAVQGYRMGAKGDPRLYSEIQYILR